MKRHRWWIITLTVILLSGMYVGYGRTEGIEPIREPEYKSPRIYTNIDGNVVFKEFFDGLTVIRIEFFDPNSRELLYGTSLQDGRQVGNREGSGIFEVEISKFNENIVKNKLFTDSGYGLVITEYKGELVGYRAYLGSKIHPSGSTFKEMLIVSIDLDKGIINRAHRRIILNNELVDFKRGFSPDTYEELYFHNDGSRTKREYKSGFLKREAHEIPDKGDGGLRQYNSAHYLQGKLAFTVITKWKHNFIQERKNYYQNEIVIYDSNNNLVGKANPVFGEILYLKEETVNGRKALQVMRMGQDLQEKVEAMKFEDE